MGAGKYRHRITIRRYTEVEDGKGGYKTEWAPIARVWARVEGMDGREAMIASALQGISGYRITIRWRDDIRQADQIVLPSGV